MPLVYLELARCVPSHLATTQEVCPVIQSSSEVGACSGKSLVSVSCVPPPPRSSWFPQQPLLELECLPCLCSKVSHWCSVSPSTALASDGVMALLSGFLP